MRIFLALLCFGVTTASAQPAAVPAEAAHLQSFLDRAEALCTSQPSRDCLDAGWKFVAPGRQQALTQSDVGNLQQNLKTWFAWRQAQLSPRERTSIGFGLLIADGIGAERLHRAFDTDGDGLVTRSELLSEVTLDSRPLGTVLADPHAVDRAGLARRLKLPPVLVESLFRQ